VATEPLLSTETRITATFVLLALAGWYLVRGTTDSTVVEAAVLIGIGVVVPTLINEWRRSAP